MGVLTPAVYVSLRRLVSRVSCAWLDLTDSLHHHTLELHVYPGFVEVKSVPFPFEYARVVSVYPLQNRRVARRIRLEWRRRSCLPPRSSEFRVVCKVEIESKASPRICLRSTTPQQTQDPIRSSIATLLSSLAAQQQKPLPTLPCSAKRQTSLVQSLGFSNHGFLNPNRR